MAKDMGLKYFHKKQKPNLRLALCSTGDTPILLMNRQDLHLQPYYAGFQSMTDATIASIHFANVVAILEK